MKKIERSWQSPLSRTNIGLLMVATTLALLGCVESLESVRTTPDKNDNCSKYHQIIHKARQTDQQAQAQGAMEGALMGALFGAVLGGMSDDSGDAMRYAAIGGIAGSLAGYSQVYAQQKEERAADQRALLRSVNDDAVAERALMTTTGDAVLGLRKCRSGQAKALTASVRAGEIEKAEARSRLQTLRKWAKVDNELISAALAGIGTRVNAYVDTAAASAGVERTMILVDTGGTVEQRSRADNVRTTAPAVHAVYQERIEQVEQAAQDEKDIDREFDTIQVLLG